MWERWVGGGVGTVSKNRPSHHKYKSPKQFQLIAYLKTSGLNGSNRILCKLCANSLSSFRRQNSDEKSAKRKTA